MNFPWKRHNDILTAFLGQGVQLVLTALYIVVLARFLKPEDFGLFAIAWVWVGFFYTLSDFGLGDRAIQSGTADSHFPGYRNATLKIGTLFFFIVAALAWPISIGYGQPLLFSLIPVVGISIFLNNLTHPYRARLRENGHFLRLNVALSGGLACAVIAAIMTGYFVASPWVLVLLFLMRDFATWEFLVILSPSLEPGHSKIHISLREAFRMGGPLTLFRFLSSINSRMDEVIIGLVLSPANLGLYNRSLTLCEMPRRNLVTPISQIGIPHLSRAFRNGISPAPIAQDLIRTAMLIWFPFALLLWTFPDSIIYLILGSQWTAAAAFLPLLASLFTLRLLLDITNQILVSKGDHVWLCKWALSILPGTCLAIALGIPHGIPGILTGLNGWYGLVVLHRYWVLNQKALLPLGDVGNALLRIITPVAAFAVIFFFASFWEFPGLVLSLALYVVYLILLLPRLPVFQLQNPEFVPDARTSA